MGSHGAGVRAGKSRGLEGRFTGCGKILRWRRNQSLRGFRGCVRTQVFEGYGLYAVRNNCRINTALAAEGCDFARYRLFPQPLKSCLNKKPAQPKFHPSQIGAGAPQPDKESLCLLCCWGGWRSGRLRTDRIGGPLPGRQLHGVGSTSVAGPTLRSDHRSSIVRQDVGRRPLNIQQNLMPNSPVLLSERR